MSKHSVQHHNVILY